MLSLSFNPEDLNRILSKINSTLEASKTFKFKWKINLLKNYKEVVATAMGSVSGRGGYPVLDFADGVSMTGVMKWNALRPYTIKRKAIEKGILTKKKASELNSAAVYSGYAAQVSIWYDTGEAKQSMVATDTFAGIQVVKDREKFKRMEHGGANEHGEVVLRPLS